MHLYIIAGRINIDVLDVTLVDGYKPSVGGYRPVDVDFEPAIWFKVMLLDAVTIDCDGRRLSWVPLSDSSLSNFAALDSGIALCGSCRLSGSLAGDDQHYLIDCSDDTLHGQLSEAFDVIPDLLARYESNAVVREIFNEQLMQLLHVHILPSIRLTAQDTDHIMACIHMLEVILNKIDGDVLEVAKKMSRLEQSSASLRKKLLCQLISDNRKPTSGSMFSHDFIDLLLSKNGLEQDIEIAWAAVELAQVTVEKLKETAEASDAALLSQRAERDRVTVEYEKLLTVREMLKEMRRGKRGLFERVKNAISAGPEDPQQNIYVGMMLQLTDFEKLNQKIMQKKLLVTSVREAARLALNDIQSGSDSFSVEVDRVGAAHPTDVLGGNIKAPWQSVAEQIASVLGNSDHPIAKLHREFTRHVTDVCSATAVEKQLYDESLRAIQCESQRSVRSKTKTSGSLTHSSSSSSMSEFQLDLSNTTFDPSFPGEQRRSLSKSVELSKPGSANRQDSLVKSLPVLQTQPEGHRRNSWSRKKLSVRPSFTSYVPPGLISISREDNDMDSPVIIVDTDRDCVRTALESIRKEMLEHFDRISLQLQNELSASSSKSQYQQIWLDYENHFYQEMMEPLTRLYQLQYASIADAFCSSLLVLTPSDLSLHEAVLIHLLWDPHEESTCSFEVCTPAAGESKDSDNGKSTSRSSTLTRATDLHGEMMYSMASECDNAEADDLSHLLRSHSEETKRPHLRTVRISLPVMIVPHSPTTVLVYERTLAPLPSECDSLQTNTRLTLSATTMTLKPCYRQQFATALKHIESAIVARTPASKLRHLTDCLRETTKQLAAFYAELYGDSSSQSSCDELLDAVVILLCNVDGRQMALLYCQLSLLADMMAPWLVRGPYSFTLVQFTGACQFIQERLMLKRNRHISEPPGSVA